MLFIFPSYVRLRGDVRKLTLVLYLSLCGTQPCYLANYMCSIFREVNDFHS